MAARITAYIVAAIVAVTFIAGLIVGAQRDENGPVDLIILNGRVYTADAGGRFAEAVAIQGNRILQVGSTREISRLGRAQTVVVDAGGGAVLPGFNDAHMELLEGGLALGGVDLGHLTSLTAVEQEIRTWAALHPDAPWVVGRGWRYEMFPVRGPTRQVLDSVVKDRPAFLLANDGQAVWVNSAALRIAGLDRKTRVPEGGRISRDPRTGEPSGALFHTAVDLVRTHVTRPGRDAERAAVRAAIRAAHRLGVTSVQTTADRDRLALYDELRTRGELDVRVYGSLPVSAPLEDDGLEQLERLADDYPDDPVLKAGAAEIDIDGSVESGGALLLPPTTGGAAARIDKAALEDLVAALDAKGWQILVRATGDAAVRMAIDAFANARDVNPEPEHGRRHRIESAETIAPADLARLASLGLTVSLQPWRAAAVQAPTASWLSRVGATRARGGWLFGTLQSAGTRLVFGSGWPAGPLDPRLGLLAAVTRTAPGQRDETPWLPDERLPLADAVDAYTRDAAWASFDEHRKGTIEPDMLADLVILSDDVFTADPAGLAAADVDMTIFDGRVVYDRSKLTTETTQ